MSDTHKTKPWPVQIANENGKKAPRNWRERYGQAAWRDRNSVAAKRNKELRDMGYTGIEAREIQNREENEVLGPNTTRTDRKRYSRWSGDKKERKGENRRLRRNGRHVDPEVAEDTPTPTVRRERYWD